MSPLRWFLVLAFVVTIMNMNGCAAESETSSGSIVRFLEDSETVGEPEGVVVADAEAEGEEEEYVEGEEQEEEGEEELSETIETESGEDGYAEGEGEDMTTEEEEEEELSETTETESGEDGYAEGEGEDLITEEEEESAPTQLFMTAQVALSSVTVETFNPAIFTSALSATLNVDADDISIISIRDAAAPRGRRALLQTSGTVVDFRVVVADEEEGELMVNSLSSGTTFATNLVTRLKDLGHSGFDEGEPNTLLSVSGAPAVGPVEVVAAAETEAEFQPTEELLDEHFSYWEEAYLLLGGAHSLLLVVSAMMAAVVSSNKVYGATALTPLSLTPIHTPL